jgi:hypothetical protein
VRRKVRKKPNPGRPLRRAARLSRGLRTGKNCRFIDEFTALILAARPLTMPGPEAYIDLTTRRPLRRDGASAKPLTVYGERASGHDLVAMTDARGFGGSGVCRRRSRKVPGCLTGESEERETWTAESLRAASSNGEGLGRKARAFSARERPWKRLRRSTFQVNTMGLAGLRFRKKQSGTSSNVVISRDQISST